MDAHSLSDKNSCCGNSKPEKNKFLDPVCGMSVNGDNPNLSLTHKGKKYHFCGAHCLEIFTLAADTDSERQTSDRKNRSFAIGVLGSTILLVVFLMVVILANGSLANSISEVSRLWHWVLLLAVGFGLQLGLFVHIRYTIRERMVTATAEVAASGAISTGSMIACCSHGLVNLLPIFGISAAAAFLARYQLPFILFGVFSNFIGITIMLGLAQRNKIIFKNSFLRSLSKLNMKVIRVALVISGITAIGISILVS